MRQRQETQEVLRQVLTARCNAGPAFLAYLIVLNPFTDTLRPETRTLNPGSADGVVADDDLLTESNPC
jgi:hypothetical protein